MLREKVSVAMTPRFRIRKVIKIHFLPRRSERGGITTEASIQPRKMIEPIHATVESFLHAKSSCSIQLCNDVEFSQLIFTIMAGSRLCVSESQKSSVVHYW